MKTPLHVTLRRLFRTYFYLLIAKLLKTKETKSVVDIKEIKTILIIRPNYRIGNLIFLTPLINAIHKNMPDVKIDMIVGMKIAGKILEPMPNINKVIDIPRSLLLHPIELYRFIKEDRQTRYDLAINIVSGSISSQIVAILCNAKYKASTISEQNITPLTHTVEFKGIYKHSGLETLEFLKLFGLAMPKDNLFLDIKLADTEIQTAQNELKDLLQTHNLAQKSKTIALFRNARFDKKIADEWWQEWNEALLLHDNSIVVIDILSPDILSRLNNKCLEYSNKDLRALSAFFKACSIYVSADTGPLHLASASGANVFALFNKTDVAIYGTLGADNFTLDINEMSPASVAQNTYAYLQKSIEHKNKEL